MVSPADSSVPAQKVNTILHVASQVGIPLAPNKLEGPTTRLVFLGILIDTNCMDSSLPDDKLHELISKLQSWSTRNKCLKRELLSLIGKLNFACRIIPAGCIFLCHLIDLSTSACLPHHHVTMKPLPILPDGSGLFLLGMAGLLYLIPAGPNRKIWNSSRIPLAVLAMASSTRATGLLIPGPLNSGTDQFSGKSSTPLPSHAFSGGFSGWERSSSFTATTKQSWIFGLLALPGTPLLCILFVPYSLVPLPTTTQFWSLILLALITLLLIPCLVCGYLSSVASLQQQT